MKTCLFFVKLNINCIAQFNVLVVNYLKKKIALGIFYTVSQKRLKVSE